MPRKKKPKKYEFTVEQISSWSPLEMEKRLREAAGDGISEEAIGISMEQLSQLVAAKRLQDFKTNNGGGGWDGTEH